MRIYETDEPCKIHIACLQAIRRTNDGALWALVTKLVSIEKVNLIASLVRKNRGINAICDQAHCGRDLVDKVREALAIPKNEPKWTYIIDGVKYDYQKEVRAAHPMSWDSMALRFRSGRFPNWTRVAREQ